VSRIIQLFACAGMLALGAWPASADALRCKDSAGHVTYTQGACPAGTRPLESADSAATSAAGTPPVHTSAPSPATPATGQSETCPPTLAADGSDADVRACSKERSLSSTAVWAQVSNRFYDFGGQRRWTGDYICLKFVDKQLATGQRVRMRPYLTVSSAARDGAMTPGFEVNTIPNKIFPTKVAAVEAACAAAAGATAAL
jgi:hypothetical protein